MALSPAANQGKELIAYLVSQNALAEAARGRDAGIPLEDAQAVVDMIDSDPQYAGVGLAARNLWQWETDVILPQIAATSRQYSYLVNKLMQSNLAATGYLHGFYVPTQRVGLGAINSMLKRTGSTRGIINPLQQIQKTYTDIMTAGFKQGVYERLIYLAGEDSGANQIGRYIREIKPGSKRIGLQKEYQNLQEELQKRIDNFAGGEVEQGTSEQDLQHMVALLEPEFPGIQGPDFRTFVLMDENRPRFFEIDNEIVKAMDDKLPEHVSKLGYKMMGILPATVLRTGATVYRAAFHPIQFIRDPIGAWFRMETAGLDIASLGEIYLASMKMIWEQGVFYKSKGRLYE